MRYKYRNMMIILAVMLTASCAKDDNDSQDSVGKAISFTGGSAELVSRADNDNLKPLNEYIQNFTVYGINGNLAADGTFTKNDKGIVFPNYKVWYTTSSSTSNTDNWEYVGQYDQTIKYWDENYNAHYFWAIGDDSRGKFEANGTTFNADGRVTSITFNGVDRTATTPVFYTEPTLVKRDGTTAGDKQGDYGKPVKLVFKQLMSHIRVGFYEDIEETSSDGLKYTVSNMWFYKPRESDGKFLNDNGNEQQSVAGSDSKTAYLSGAFPKTANVQLNYNYTDAEKTSSATTTVTSSDNYMTLGTVKMPEDGKLPDSSKQPAYVMNGESEFFDVLPYEDNADENGLTLKCDYEITTTRGGSTTTRNVIAKLATVPAIYCKWKPNYSYTYIFKISDQGNTFVLFKVLVSGWESGGTQDVPWHNW